MASVDSPSLNRRDGGDYGRMSDDEFGESDRAWNCDPCGCVGCCKKCWRESPVEDAFNLTAMQKWTKYRKPPWKLLITLLIVIATTTQVILFTVYISAYVRDTKLAIQNLFKPPVLDMSVTTRGQVSTYHIYTKSTLETSLTHVATTYFNQQNISLDYYGFERTANGEISPIELTVEQYKAGNDVFNTDVDFDDATTSTTYNIAHAGEMKTVWQHYIEPHVHTLRSIDTKIDLINYNLDSVAHTCYHWSVTGKYSALSSGKIDLVFGIDPRVCSSQTGSASDEKGFDSWVSQPARDGYIVLLVFIIILTFLSQVLYVRAIFRHFRLLGQPDGAGQVAILSNSTRAPDGGQVLVLNEDLSCWQKLKTLKLWVFCATVGNVLNFSFACFCLGSGLLASDSGPWLVVMGVGVLCAWVSMTQFFESTSSYYVLVTTLSSGIPRVWRFFVGVLPIFFAYATFGVALFSGYSVRFSSFDTACVTLFSLLNGDVIHDVFEDIHPNSPVVSRIFLYSFLALFIYAVLNIFVAIIEDSFFATKQIQDEEERESKRKSKEKRQDKIMRLLDEEDAKNPNRKRTSVSQGFFRASGDFPVDDEKAGYYADLSTRADYKATAGRQGSMDEDYFGGRADGKRRPELSEGLKSAIATEEVKFQQLLDTVKEALSTDLQEEFAQVAMELKFPNEMLRPPHEDAYYPCEFPDCIYCAVRKVLLDCLDEVKPDVKDCVEELLAMMQRLEGTRKPSQSALTRSESASSFARAVHEADAKN